MKLRILSTFLVLLFLSCTSENELEDVYQINQTEKTILQKRNSQKNLDPCIMKVGVKPCGLGFKVFLGLPDGTTPDYDVYYQISESWWSPILDSGSISSGELTNWVLEPCTTYVIKIYLPKCKKPIVITATSDGCGGVFIC